MGFCYRFKLRMSAPRCRLPHRILSFSLAVPAKCRMLSRGRFCYSPLSSPLQGEDLGERPVQTILEILKDRLRARKYQKL